PHSRSIMSDPNSQNPETRRLQQLLETPMGSKEEADWLAELELDERDRQALEDLAADGQFRHEVLKYLRQPPPHDPSITRILAGIDFTVAEPDQPSLDFLEPAGSDEYIGQFDGYQVIECVGSGGMGIVLKAWEPSLN